MSETEIINEEPNIPETVPQSQEDKFFGYQIEFDSLIITSKHNPELLQ